ncbi:hypothetical protein Tco_0149762 [Tanacetum coccineum]
MSQAKEAQIKLYKTREDKELDKVIALENKVKVLNDIVYKTGQSVQTMNMLNRNYKTSFAKPEFFKKAQRANPRLYDIGSCGTDLYSISLQDSKTPNPICLMAKATLSQAWLCNQPSRDRNVKDDNKRTRNAFATTTNLMRREYTSVVPKCANCNLHHSPESP